MQGSSAFVYGWVAFCDRLSNGVTVKIIQGFAPHSVTRCDKVLLCTCMWPGFNYTLYIAFGKDGGGREEG